MTCRPALLENEIPADARLTHSLSRPVTHLMNDDDCCGIQLLFARSVPRLIRCPMGSDCILVVRFSLLLRRDASRRGTNATRDDTYSHLCVAIVGIRWCFWYFCSTEAVLWCKPGRETRIRVRQPISIRHSPVSMRSKSFRSVVSSRSLPHIPTTSEDPDHAQAIVWNALQDGCICMDVLDAGGRADMVRTKTCGHVNHQTYILR